MMSENRLILDLVGVIRAPARRAPPAAAAVARGRAPAGGAVGIRGDRQAWGKQAGREPRSAGAGEEDNA